jgi:hypothetical protein
MVPIPETLEQQLGTEGVSWLGLSHISPPRAKLTWYSVPGSCWWWRVTQAWCQRLPWVPDRDHSCVSSSPCLLMARRSVPAGRGRWGSKGLAPQRLISQVSTGPRHILNLPGIHRGPASSETLTDLGPIHVVPEAEALLRNCWHLGPREQVGSLASGRGVCGVQKHEKACRGAQG